MASRRSLPDLAVVSAHRARIQAARAAAFAEPDAGLVYVPRPRDVNVFFFGELAQPEALRQFLEPTSPAAGAPLELRPARVVRHELVTFDGKEILVRTAWWHEGYSRFPEPGADGMLVRGLRSDAVAPLLKAHYGEDWEQRPVTVRVDGEVGLKLAIAYVWEGYSVDPGLLSQMSTRRMFFYGSLTDPHVLRDVLGFSGPLTLTPAALHGWRLRRWGQYPALVPGARDSKPVKGVIFECPGTFLDRLEAYEGNKYAPTEVRVVQEGATQSISAWCYAWNGALEDLQD